MSKPFYITTTLPYVNSDPHVGFAMELVRADVIARYRASQGRDVFFNTGTDEHGIKIYRKAQEQGINTQKYVDGYAARFKLLAERLNIASGVSNIQFNFIRTTDPHHIAAAQAFWKLVDERGKKDPRGPFIYKKQYAMKYCVGCELEKTDSELDNGKCPLHPLMDLEIINEENYFFKMSAFKDDLLALYAANPQLVIPDFRFNEIKQFVSGELTDISISRLVTKMPWGVPVPGDEQHVMYVWFDALVDYISAIGWPDDVVAGKSAPGSFKKWWNESGGLVQYCGKDNVRQQSLTWQSMLLAAGLAPSQTIVIDGFVTGEGGVKMSKSLGNVIDPFALMDEYGSEALRYFVLRELQPFEDSPFTVEKFKEAYNAHLANGVGNLTSRIMKMAEGAGVVLEEPDYARLNQLSTTDSFVALYWDGLENFNLKKSMDAIWHFVEESDKSIQSNQPFKLIKSENAVDQAKGRELIKTLLGNIYQIGFMLKPFMPQTSDAIIACVKSTKMPAQPLFMRK